MGADTSDICMVVQSLKARVSATLTAKKRQVASGQQIPVIVHVANATGVSGPVAVHDACHHLHAQGIGPEVRRTLREAGAVPVDLGDGGRCCGARRVHAADGV